MHNEKYKGDSLFQKSFISSPITHKRKKNKGELTQYYAENSIPIIVDRKVWDLVAAERLRRSKYCEEHSIDHYANSTERFPLSSRITCSICDSTYQLLTSKRLGEEGNLYWRCTSFHGNRGTPIDGEMFTPRAHPLRNGDESKRWTRYQRKHRKLPEPRQMLCTDIEIEGGKPEKAFITAWNLLVSKKLRYQASLKRTVSLSDDILLQYRAECLCQLIDNVGKIKDYDYRLALQTLERIEVTPTGKLSVYFLGGLKITL